MNWCQWPNTSVNFEEFDCSNLTTDYDQTACRDTQDILLCMKASRVLATIVCASSIYCCLVVSLYEIKHRKKNESAALSRLYFISLFVTMVYSIIVTLNTHQKWPFPYCVVHGQTLTGFYTFCTLIIYTILWARQRSFYNDPLLSKTETAAVRWLSRLVIIFIYIGIVGVVIPFTFSYCMVQTVGGCIPKWNRVKVARFLLPTVIIFTIVNLSAKLLLLGLILNPILRGKKVTLRHYLKNLLTARRGDIYRLINRLAASTIVCIFSSLVLGLFIYLAAQGLACVAWDAVCGLDLCVMNVAIICSFSNGALRLCPVTIFTNKIKADEIRSVTIES